MIKALEQKQNSDDEEENNDEDMNIDVEGDIYCLYWFNSDKLGDDSANPGVRVDEDEEEKE